MSIELIPTIINALAGIGAFSVIQSILGTIFHPTSSSDTNPALAMVQMMQTMMTMQMLPAMMSMFKPPSSGGGLGDILMIIGPIIAIVLVLVLLKKKL